MSTDYLYDKIMEYGKSDNYPFHMPGHKRQKEDFANPFALDLTEIEGFDNLHCADGILQKVQERAARLYGSQDTYYLVNGSTCGILSAVFACTSQGGRILMARNCHKAVYHAVCLRELEVGYLYPKREREYGIYGGITPEEVADALKKYQNVQAVVITSPTYDGVVSDMEGIAQAVHAYGIPLIVDEAHGAHFGFHPYFPQSALSFGADLVIHSLHKTLPSLTQTALIHRKGELVEREQLKRYLGIFQTSSPSYVFMAGMDECIRTLENQKRELFESFAKRLEAFSNDMQQLQVLRLGKPEQIKENGIYGFDPSKLILSVRGTSLDGKGLMEWLRRDYHLEMEMEAGTYALALTTICDTREGFLRLKKALLDIDHLLKKEGVQRKEDKISDREEENFIKNPVQYKISEAWNQKGKCVLRKDACGKISREFLYLYPPGIPLLIPGEEITEKLLEEIAYYSKRGYSLQGAEDRRPEHLWIME